MKPVAHIMNGIEPTDTLHQGKTCSSLIYTNTLINNMLWPLKTFYHDSLFVGLIDFVNFDNKYVATCNSITWFHTVSYMQNEATVAWN
jgi:hypothetical protein